LILYLEPVGGLAGDMFLAALLDLEHPAFTLRELEALAKRLVPERLELVVSEARRGGFRVRRLDVRTDESEHPPVRHLPELLSLLAGAGLPPAARACAERVLQRLARAEARVHGIPLEEVHFHEVGAIDTLIDVGGVALALERLGVQRVLASAPYVGGGIVLGAHGVMPVPTPGTLELLRGVPLRTGPGGERVTPTGAALLAELVERYDPEETLCIERTGFGGGAREPKEGPANLVRVSLARGVAAGMRGELWQLECNLDDATGEELAFLLEELRRAGARDAWLTPVLMKKGRPGCVVAALARAAERAALEEVLWRHSPTLGLRWLRTERVECAREELVVDLEGQALRVKVRLRPGAARVEACDLSPEQDDLASLVRAGRGERRELERRAIALALEALGGGALPTRRSSDLAGGGGVV